MIVKKPLKVSDVGGIGPTGSNITLNGTNDKLVSFRKKDGGDLISLQDLERHTIKFFSTTGGLGRLPIETLLNNNYKQAYIQILTTSDLEPLKLKGLMDYGILHYYPNYLHGNGNGNGTQMVLRYITGTPEIYIRFARNGAGNGWSDWTRFLNELNIENYAVKNRLGFSTPEHINNFRYPTNYETTVQDGTTIGLPEGTGYAYIKHFGWIDSNGNSMQIAMNFGLSAKGTDNFWVMKIRASNYDSWGPWFTIPTYFSENTHNYGLRDYHTTTDANRVRGTLNIRAGIYGTTANTPTNVNDDGFIIPIFLDNQTYGVQLYVTHYSNKLWIRRMQNGAWQPWFCIANGDSFYFNNENHFCASSAYNHIKTRHIEGDCPNQDGSLYLNWHNGKPVYFKHTDGTVHSIQEVFQLAVDGKNTIINGINTALGYNSGLNTGHTWNDLNWWMLNKVANPTYSGYNVRIWWPNEFTVTHDQDVTSIYYRTNIIHTHDLSIPLEKIHSIIPWSFPYYLEFDRSRENSDSVKADMFKVNKYGISMSPWLKVYRRYDVYGSSSDILDQYHCNCQIPYGQNIYRVVASRGNNQPKPNIWDHISCFIVFYRP